MMTIIRRLDGKCIETQDECLSCATLRSELAMALTWLDLGLYNRSAGQRLDIFTKGVSWGLLSSPKEAEAAPAALWVAVKPLEDPDVRAALPRIIERLQTIDGESWVVGETLRRLGAVLSGQEEEEKEDWTS